MTTLNLDHQHITKLSNLDKLENLRWASFNDNDITKIEVWFVFLRVKYQKKIKVSVQRKKNFNQHKVSIFSIGCGVFSDFEAVDARTGI